MKLKHNKRKVDLDIFLDMFIVRLSNAYLKFIRCKTFLPKQKLKTIQKQLWGKVLFTGGIKKRI